MLLLQILRKHAMRIDFNELPSTSRQHFSAAVANFRQSDMLAAPHSTLPSLHYERFEQRNRFQVLDSHCAGKGDDFMLLAHLPHSLIKNGGDDAPVGMCWWTGESPVEAKATDEASLLGVVNETQA